jgi:hypothetical protein
MKFKKVEIQAFRAYNKVEDGTFDFTTKSDEVADFISIYAPNGSGKTSFYDAIEWGFTRKISRFHRQKGDDKSSVKTEERNFRMRNRFAEEETESVVRLYTTSKDLPFEEKLSRTGLRLNEKKAIKGREYFHYVLQSQESIDAILKEDDANLRYEKIIRSFGDVALDRKYRTIIELINLNDNKINELAQELYDLQSKADDDFDDEVLLKINSEIELLNKKGENIPVVRFDWTEKQIQQLTDLLSERTIDLNYKISKLKENKKSDKEAILSMEELVLSFEKTKAYKESVLPFLKYDKQKQAENEILEKITFLEKKVHPKLEQERKKIAKYIDNQIKSFFDMKLINLLYQKMDPHPIHEEIKFECDFGADKPQLNAFVIDENESITPIVPSLFFSAPQLNTLSLSLFLAKALNVKDNKGNAVDCIFIDDPVQSMDSLNILSVIDLLRSISVNMGKQIFLATCDENLYYLLQKKIPSDRFNAKYIELETFGKVKS